MADNPTKPRWEVIAQLLVRATPAIGGILALGWLFAVIGPVPSPKQDGSVGPTGPFGFLDLLQFGMAVVIAFGVAALLRYALKPLLPAERPAPATAASAEATRDQVGPYVLGIGTVAIAILAVALIIAFYELARRAPYGPVGTKIDALLMSVFTAVLPVFATWVGTVLAFYFTKESFRQAAQSSLEAVQGAKPQALAIDRMIPYDNIGKIEVDDEAAARNTSMKDVFEKFNDQTTMCLIFDKKKKTPLFIIRNKNPPMPANWNKAYFDKAENKETIAHYLKENNETDAAKFDFLARNATLEAARTKMATMEGNDLFITDTGQKTEPVLGWLPGDKLK